MSATRTLAAVLSAGLVPAYEWMRAGSHPLTWEQLTLVLPGGPYQEYLRDVNAALREGGIATPRRVAAFLAQVGHESSELRHLEELGDGRAYEGREDLGNVRPGDGTRYKGRGPIQLTGRANYRAAGRALGVPLEEQPELAAQPRTGFRVAAWYWNSRGLSQLADSGTLEDFRSITTRVNGGQNGAASRERYWRTAMAALGG